MTYACFPRERARRILKVVTEVDITVIKKPAALGLQHCRRTALRMTSPENEAWVQRILAASKTGVPPDTDATMHGVTPPICPTAHMWCNESMPAGAAIPGWPPTSYPWLNKLDGLGPPKLAPAMPPDLGGPGFPALPITPVTGRAGVPMAGPARRKDRMSEVDKLKARLSALEDTIEAVRQGFEKLLAAQEKNTARRADNARGAAAGGSIQLTAVGSEHIDHGSNHIDHGSDHRRERTELNLSFDDLDALKNSALLDEFIRSL